MCGNKHPSVVGRKAKQSSHFGRLFDGFRRKLNIFLPYDPAVVHLGISPRGLKTYVLTEPCTGSVTAALFISARIGKLPMCPSVGERIDKLWYLPTMHYYQIKK